MSDQEFENEIAVAVDNTAQVEVKPIKVVVDMTDVAVLLLLPELPAFKVEDPLQIELCGRSIINWSRAAIDTLPCKEVAVRKTDDIMTIVREHATDHKYTVLLYADTPLITSQTLDQAVAYVRAYGHNAGRMSRGWVFETEYIKTAEEISPEDIPNLTAEDFIVAYNYSQLALIESIARQRINLRHLSGGVRIIDTNTAYIDADVVIKRGVTIEPNVHIKGSSFIKSGASILTGSRVVQSEVGEDTIIGPYSNLREGNTVGMNCRIATCVELKNSQIGDKTKIAHMSYAGDSIIGKNCNIGCGVVFCNYNGKVKEKCVLGNNVFVGSNCNLVAPLKLENNAYVAAGSTITKDVPAHALAIARSQQNIKENYWNVETESAE